MTKPKPVPPFVPAAIPAGAVGKFIKLFPGSRLKYGLWDPAGEHRSTVAGPATVADYRAHLQGVIGLALDPAAVDGTCIWAALDIDVHGGPASYDTSPEAIADKVGEAGLPLVASRSKCGGVHAHTWFAQPVSAADARSLLGEWAAMLGVARCKVHPRESSAFVNLPYFAALEPYCNRYAVIDARPASLGRFMDQAEAMRVASSAALVEHLAAAQRLVQQRVVAALLPKRRAYHPTYLHRPHRARKQ